VTGAAQTGARHEVKKPSAPKTTPQRRPGQLVLNQAQVGLVLGFVVIGLIMAFGVGFIVGMWYQSSERVTSYEAEAPAAKAQHAADQPMTFYSTLTESSATPAPPASKAGKDTPGKQELPLQQQRTATTRPGMPALVDAGYSVQVGSFRGREQAERLRGRLRRKGYPTWIQTSLVPEHGIWYRVRVGHFADRTAADQTAQRLISQEGLSVMVTAASP
jgi:cell division septation protein DedD